MDRRTNKKRIEELEAMLKKPWYGTLEFWSIATSMRLSKKPKQLKKDPRYKSGGDFLFVP